MGDFWGVWRGLEGFLGASGESLGASWGSLGFARGSLRGSQESPLVSLDTLGRLGLGVKGVIR